MSSKKEISIDCLYGLYIEAADRADLTIFVNNTDNVEVFDQKISIASITENDNEIIIKLAKQDHSSRTLKWTCSDIKAAKQDHKGPPKPEISLYFSKSDDRYPEDGTEDWEFIRPNKLAEYGLADGDPENPADLSNHLEKYNLESQIDPTEYSRLMNGERYDHADGKGWIKQSE